MGKQVRVYQEEFQILLDKAQEEGVSVQVALSIVIREWKEYDKVHQQQNRIS